MKISTPNFDKHSFSSPQKQAPKKKVEKSFEFWANIWNYCGENSQHEALVLQAQKLQFSDYLLPS
jgi:hypothetical protein